MNFQEEYFKRHLIVSPVVKYVKEGYLILRHPGITTKTKWVIFSILESPQSGHPNESQFTELLPKYNGYSSPKGVTGISTISMNFDDYYSKISSKIKEYETVGFKPVFGFAESRIAVVEIFMHIWCSYLLDVYKGQIIKDYFAVVSPERSIEEKMEFVDKIDGLLMDSSSVTRESWKMFRRYANPDFYCSWIKSWA